MKIAILISGEYRKLDVTRKNMPFLDSADVDIYVSTWDKTIYENKKINLYIEESITEDRILNDLGKHATICIENHQANPGKRYNSKMIDRWIKGFDLISNSGIHYDYVMIMRTDIFFQDDRIVEFKDMEKYDNAIGFAWANSLHLGKLPDLIFLSTFNNMKVMFETLTVDLWNDSNNKEFDWHVWWYKFVNALPTDIIHVPEMSYITFCRYWVQKTHTILEAVNIHHDWRDLRLLHECDLYGDQYAKGIWPDNILIEAKEKWQTGYFNKYL